VRSEPFVLSVVVPVFNEAACVAELFSRVEAAVAAEVVFVDDASDDGSFAAIAALQPVRCTIRALRLGENVGSQVAIACGLAHASGDIVATMDADLQHPPELLPAMVDAWRAGADIVEMVRRNPEPLPALRAIGTRAFYTVFNLVADVPVSPLDSDFRLLDRRCVDALVAQPHAPGFLRGAVHALPGARQAIQFDSPARFAGTTGYSFGKLVRGAVDALRAKARGKAVVVDTYERAP
jgi:dolichol-phosphate mannosyltransferase